jgi:hypothetical protein
LFEKIAAMQVSHGENLVREFWDASKECGIQRCKITKPEGGKQLARDAG